MSNPYLGEIRLFASNFAPSGWQLCNGQLLPISQYTALFSLLGTFYGGNGINTFALPDLRGRVPIHQGSNAGNTFGVGQSGGTENVTVLTNQLPVHSHALQASLAPADQTTASGNVVAQQASGSLYTSATPSTLLSPQALAMTGGNVPHSNLQPFLCVSFIIALQGIFPSRN